MNKNMTLIIGSVVVVVLLIVSGVFYYNVKMDEKAEYAKQTKYINCIKNAEALQKSTQLEIDRINKQIDAINKVGKGSTDKDFNQQLYIRYLELMKSIPPEAPAPDCIKYLGGK